MDGISSLFPGSLSHHWQFEELVVSIPSTLNSVVSCYISGPMLGAGETIVSKKGMIPSFKVIVV